MRNDNRKITELRKITIEPNYLLHPEGSVLISIGNTKVICTATVEDQVPRFLRGQNSGWIHAEYNMLPRATQQRKQRDAVRGQINGRTMEIQRMIARSLRSIVDLKKLGERTIVVDCDVIQADGGTRTASITGGFVALSLAVQKLVNQQLVKETPILDNIAAISVGMTSEEDILLDLDFSEDSTAAVDMNLVMTSSGKFVEIQGAGEKAPFSKEQMNEMMELGKAGILQLFDVQNKAIREGNRMNQNLAPLDLSKSKKEILIATRNKGKAAEFESLFGKKGFAVKTLLDYPDIPDVEETGTTFAENALLKAETIADKLNMLVLADDSGLKVDYLDGNPGVYSARYAGERKSDAANNAKLLHELTNVPPEKRTAQFHCTLALAAPGKDSLVVEGEVDGRILSIPHGENGFGYDPLFFVAEKNKTMAEMTEEEKNAISHRAKALINLEKVWDEWISMLDK